MVPAGYVALRLNSFQGHRPRLQAQWMNQIPAVYAKEILGVKETGSPADDEQNCLAVLRNYGSLMSMAQEARKPMFDLKPADGAVGSYAPLVRECFEDFEGLATMLALECGLKKPT